MFVAGSQEDRTAVHQANASCCQPGGYENDKPVCSHSSIKAYNKTSYCFSSIKA